MKITIEYSDGRYFWFPERMASSGARLIEVPDSTIEMWEAAARLDSALQAQLRTLDDDRILEDDTP